MLSMLTDRLPRPSRKLLALDWDEHSFKAVEATLQKNVLRVNRVATGAIPATVKVGDPDSLGPFIRQVLAEKRFGTRQVLIAVPRDKAILIPLRLPSAAIGDLSNMVRLQASRELPFAADEAVMDFAGAVAHDAPEFVDVTVAAVQREVLAHYRQIASAAGLHLVRIGLRPNSNLIAVTRGVQPFTDERILLVDIASKTTEINIFRWGRLSFSRSVNVNVVTADAAGPADDAAGRPILMEVLRTVEAYRATDPNRIDQVIIAGDTGLEGWLAEALRTRLNTVASLYDPTWTIAIDKTLAADMTGFAAVLGLLAGQLVPVLSRFDLHAPKRPVNFAAIRRRQIIGLSAAAAVLVFGAWISSHSYLGKLRAQAADLVAANAVLKKQADAADAIGKRVGTAQKWISRDLVWLDKLREVVEQLPDNQKAYSTRLAAKPSTGEIADARVVQMGLRMSDWQVPKTLQDAFGKTNRFAIIPGPIRQVMDPKYGYTSDVTIVIPPEKPKPAGKAPAKPAGPVTEPAPAEAPEPAPGSVPQTAQDTSAAAQPVEDTVR